MPLLSFVCPFRLALGTIGHPSKEPGHSFRLSSVSIFKTTIRLSTTVRLTLRPMEPTLEQLARDYYGAKRGEFIIDDDEAEIVKENAKNRLDGLVAAACEVTASLLEHAESESVRWNIAKYIIDRRLHKVEGPEDELEKIIKGLRKKPATDAASST